MKYSKWISASAMALALVAAGCDDSDGPGDETFAAALNGDKERPTPVVTPAVGVATFTLSDDGNTLSWDVTTTGLNNVIAAHIHVGGAEVAGPIAFGLFAGPTVNPLSDPVISGSITRAAFVSPLGITFDGLIELMRNGDTYTNVHTATGNLPINTGPGNFPGGEIRGQIIPVDD
jgi:hypothetical protein